MGCQQEGRGRKRLEEVEDGGHRTYSTAEGIDWEGNQERSRTFLLLSSLLPRPPLRSLAKKPSAVGNLCLDRAAGHFLQYTHEAPDNGQFHCIYFTGSAFSFSHLWGHHELQICPGVGLIYCIHRHHIGGNSGGEGGKCIISNVASGSRDRCT